MSCEIIGRLVEKLQVITGESRNGKWQKQEFVVETYDQYPKKICVGLWGDKVSMIGNYAVGDKLKLSINIESREYNGKYFTNITAWRIEKEADEGMSLPPADELPPEISEGEDDLPF